MAPRQDAVRGALRAATRRFNTNILAQPSALRTFKVERYPGWTDGSDSLSSSETEPLLLDELLAYADDEGAELWKGLSLGYPSHNEGSPFLRREILAQYGDQMNDLMQVNVCAPQEGIYLASQALLAPGDHMIATTPLYQSLGEVARSIGCQVTAWRPEGLDGSGDGPRFNPATLAALVQPGRTKLIVANLPHNPTGALPTADEFAEIVRLCEATGCHLLVDEMYRSLEHDAAAMLPAACEVYEKGVSLSGLSKTVGLPGLRIGWLASRDDELMTRVTQLKDYTTICPPAPSEVLGFIALRAQGALLARSRDIIGEGLAATRTMALALPEHLEWLEPRAGTFSFVKLRALGAGDSSESYCEALRARANIMLMPGALFEMDQGAEGDAAQRVRVTYGRRDNGPKLDRWADDLRRFGVGH